MIGRDGGDAYVATNDCHRRGLYRIDSLESLVAPGTYGCQLLENNGRKDRVLIAKWDCLALFISHRSAVHHESTA